MTPQDYLSLAIEPALSLLPPRMDSPEARAMLIAIGLQESRLMHRRQIRGPARGYLQFEISGVLGVSQHRASRSAFAHVLSRLDYGSPEAVHAAIEHNDVLGAVMGRLLLWTLPNPLPKHGELAEGWSQYLSAWRPGKPHAETWKGCFEQAWSVIDG